MQDSSLDYASVLSKDPMFPYLHVLLGDFYEKRQAVDTALKYYTKAIGIEPEYAVPYWYRGRLYEQQGRLPEALSDYTNARTYAIDRYWQTEAETAAQRVRAAMPTPTPNAPEQPLTNKEPST